MAHKKINKVNKKLKFLHQKSKYLAPNLRRLLSSALIQPHFDYPCSSRYPNCSKKLKSNIQTLQNKCICFCLRLDKMELMSLKKIETKNWLLLKERFNQCKNSPVFKYFYKQCRHYLKKVSVKAPESGLWLRNSYHKLKQPFRKTSMGQNSLSLQIPFYTKTYLCALKLILRQWTPYILSIHIAGLRGQLLLSWFETRDKHLWVTKISSDILLDFSDTVKVMYRSFVLAKDQKRKNSSQLKKSWPLPAWR